MKLTLARIAEHLDLNPRTVSDMLPRLHVSPKTHTLDEIRAAYLRDLRAKAEGLRSTSSGHDLAGERAKTERVDRELKELLLAEKKKLLIPVSEIQPAIACLVTAARAELNKAVTRYLIDLKSLYEVDADPGILRQYIDASLSNLTSYEYSPSSRPVEEDHDPE